MLLFKNHFRIILNSKSQNFKNQKAKIKFINSYTKRVWKNISQWLLLAGKSKQREQSFNYCRSKSRWFWECPKYDLIFDWLFSYYDSNFWYFSCICKVTSMVAQSLSQALFYSTNKKFVLIHFQPTLPSYAPRKYQKTFNFLIFSVGISGFKWNIGWKWVK